jgi:hypothetical protein
VNRIVHVPAYFAPITEEKVANIPTGEKTRDLFGLVELDRTRPKRQRVQTGWSDCTVDDARLAEDMANEIAALNEEGYEIVAVVPITSGYHHGSAEIVTGTYGYGYGYSYTSGVILVAKEMT